MVNRRNSYTTKQKLEIIKFAEENKDATLITIPCGDEYSKLLSNNKEKIKEYYNCIFV